MYRYLVIIGDNIYRVRVFQHAKIFSNALKKRNIKIRYEIIDGNYPMLELYDYNAEPVWNSVYNYRVFQEMFPVVDRLSTRELDKEINDIFG